MAEVVHCKNIGTIPHASAFNSRPYVIKPGQSAILEREAAVKDFGDWSLRNESAEIHKRLDEYHRVQGHYGCGPDTIRDENTPVWDEVMPRVELSDESGNPIISVLDDPQGNSLPEDTTGQDGLERQLDLMRQRMAELEDMLNRGQDRPAVVVAEDSPDTAPRRRGRPPKVTGADHEEQMASFQGG